MGVSPPALDASLRPGTTIELAFDDVTEDRVEVAALDRYLAAADVLPGAPSVAALLDADDVYVTTVVVSCRRLLVSATRADGQTVALQAPGLAGAVDARVSVSVDHEDSTTIAYRGRAPLAFGFKAVRLMYDDGRYRALRRVAPGRVMRGGAIAPAADPLEVAGPFARLR
jgi:hypothetical protein